MNKNLDEHLKRYIDRRIREYQQTLDCNNRTYEDIKKEIECNIDDTVQWWANYYFDNYPEDENILEVEDIYQECWLLILKNFQLGLHYYHDLYNENNFKKVHRKYSKDSLFYNKYEYDLYDNLEHIYATDASNPEIMCEPIEYADDKMYVEYANKLIVNHVHNHFTPLEARVFDRMYGYGKFKNNIRTPDQIIEETGWAEHTVHRKIKNVKSKLNGSFQKQHYNVLNEMLMC